MASVTSALDKSTYNNDNVEIKRRTIFFNPLTAGAAYIQVFIFYLHIGYHFLNMVEIKYDINQQYLKTVDLHFVKSE